VRCEIVIVIFSHKSGYLSKFIKNNSFLRDFILCLLDWLSLRCSMVSICKFFFLKYMSWLIVFRNFTRRV